MIGLLLAAAVATAVPVDLDQRTREVASLLRCPVCQGLSVADSPAPMAVSMKAEVRQLLAKGYDEEQVLASFEASYGESVRLRPPLRGMNWIVWLAPVGALLAGLAWLGRWYRAACRNGTASGPPRPAPLRPLAWAVTMALAVTATVVLVSRATTERAPGAALTGDLPPRALSSDARKTVLEEKLRLQPGDIDARLELAALHLEREEMMAVFEHTRQVLERAPGHPVALTYQAPVRLAMGEPGQALDLLRQALARDPGYVEAWRYVMLIHAVLGDFDKAEQVITTVGQHSPQSVSTFRDTLARVRADVTDDGPRSASLEGNPHAAVALPASSSSAAAGVAGTLTAGTIAMPAGTRVFITLRAARQTSGPPIAAKAFDAADLPSPFEVGPGDSMMGQALPTVLRVEARTDSDGDPLTRSPDELVAHADDVPLGSAAVRLVLAPRK